MATNGQLTIMVFADIILGPNGIRSFCGTLLDWTRGVQGVRVVVVTPSREDQNVDCDNGNVIGVRPNAQVPNPFYREFLLGYYAQSKLRKIIEAIEGPKVIHIASPGMLCVSAAKVAQRLNLPLAGCYHMDTRGQCVEPYFRIRGRLAGGIAAFLDRRAYGNCQALCAPSASAAEAAKSFYKGDVTVIPNPINVNRFRPAADRKGWFREKYGADGKLLAVVIGRVAREKNLDLICEHLLHDKRIQTVFVGDGPYSDHLRRRWNATVIGFLHGDELLAAYQQADVFVQLSVLETFGLTLAEAMACGLPAIVLRAGGVVRDLSSHNGVEVIEENELSKLADRCVAFVADRQRYGESSRSARGFAERLAPDKVLPRFVELHEKLLR